MQEETDQGQVEELVHPFEEKEGLLEHIQIQREITCQQVDNPQKHKTITHADTQQERR